jgi:hypothetical protein
MPPLFRRIHLREGWQEEVSTTDVHLAAVLLPLVASIAAVPTSAVVFAFGHVDIQHSAVEVTAVESGNGRFALTVIIHFNQSKPRHFRFAGP